MIKEDHTVKGEFMARLKCPKCETELDEIIRVIEIRCRYDKQDDDYLTQEKGSDLSIVVRNAGLNSMSFKNPLLTLNCMKLTFFLFLLFLTPEL